MAVINICKLLVLFVSVRPKWQHMQLFIKSLRHQMEGKQPLTKVSTGGKDNMICRWTYRLSRSTCKLSLLVFYSKCFNIYYVRVNAATYRVNVCIYDFIIHIDIIKMTQPVVCICFRLRLHSYFSIVWRYNMKDYRFVFMGLMITTKMLRCYPLTYRDRMNVVQDIKYHGCWFPVSLRR